MVLNIAWNVLLNHEDILEPRLRQEHQIDFGQLIEHFRDVYDKMVDEVEKAQSEATNSDQSMESAP